jgi:hypothetical protein
MAISTGNSVVRNRSQQLQDIGAVNRWKARENFIKNCRETIDISSKVDRIKLTASLLQRHVRGGTQRLPVNGCGSSCRSIQDQLVARLRIFMIEPFRQTPIDDRYFTKLADDDVIAFQVAMNDIAVVRVGDGRAAGRLIDGLRLGIERAAPPPTRPPPPRAERSPEDMAIMAARANEI